MSSEADQAGPRAPVVVRTPAGTFRAEVAAGAHAFVVDEPVSLGGTDLGPTPYELIDAALGACTAITVQMYARRKDWPLEDVLVRVDHRRERVAAPPPGEPPGRADHVRLEVELRGPLTPEQRRRLLEIADRCPVHRTLEAGVAMETRERVE